MKKEVLRIFGECLGRDYLLFIFGSHAADKTDRISDIDLAVYRKEPIASSLMAAIREELENKVRTLRFFDVVNLTQPLINKKLAGNILKKGVLWHQPKNSKELLTSLKRRLANTKKS